MTRQKCPQRREFQRRFTFEYCEFVAFKFQKLLNKAIEDWVPRETFEEIYEKVFQTPPPPSEISIPRKRGRPPKKKHSPSLDPPNSPTINPVQALANPTLEEPIVKHKVMLNIAQLPQKNIAIATDMPENVVPFRLVADRQKIRRIRASRERWQGIFLKRNLRIIDPHPHRRRPLLSPLSFITKVPLV